MPIIKNLLVQKNYRNLGIGNKLVEKAVEEAEKQKAFEIHVWVEFNNQLAKNFYLKQGFRKRALLLEKKI